MNFKRVFSTILAALLLAGCGFALAAPGSSDDPLITRSYADGAFYGSVVQRGDSLLSDFRTYVEALLAGTPAAPKSPLLATGSGGTVTLSSGASVVLLMGTAAFSFSDAAVLDMTDGSEVQSGGNVIKYHKYAVSYGTVTLLPLDAIIVSATGGAYAVSGAGRASPFLDVDQSKWFFNGVTSAVEQGMINGRKSTIYDPDNTISYAETMKLAACLHQKTLTGAVTLQNGNPWFQTYVDYCLQNGIAQAYTNYDAKITRAEFVRIFYAAMPSSNYTAKNTIADGAIPDVPMTAPYAAEIYALYRAGILTGDAATATSPAGRFRPGDTIKRSEVAVILNRMYDVSARMSVNLG